ncbi:MAG: DHHA1 domain-containing protein, partial [Thermoleophilia bacterium]
GGTHVANTAEVGIFKIASEGSSAANVRRIEALSGPAAIDWFREREQRLHEVGELLGSPQDPLSAARRAAERLREAGVGARKAQSDELSAEAGKMVDRAADLAVGGSDGEVVALVEATTAAAAEPKQLLELANRVQSKLGRPSVVVLGGDFGGKAGLVALVSKDAVERGVSAASIIREIAPIVGGGGGGRDDMAQAGGKDASKLEEALAAAKATVEGALA